MTESSDGGWWEQGLSVCSDWGEAWQHFGGIKSKHKNSSRLDVTTSFDNDNNNNDWDDDEDEGSDFGFCEDRDDDDDEGNDLDVVVKHMEDVGVETFYISLQPQLFLVWSQERQRGIC